ncbi:ABC-2 transporter permease [Bifidobacterium oedipodis]|uniref:ABC-2 family transporter protein n=1 Tax=Bifidobacterium oedipodis TaxID=2675322 RepID=A0A7Y0HR24_9BIFI|nr:ABC-2 transporter permease [Bifidobacterium sp. DSM 109957]NMM93555.1 ABC-2 family transporter protein [Bifidobacterium sp. DSM 109957]
MTTSMNYSSARTSTVRRPSRLRGIALSVATDFRAISTGRMWSTIAAFALPLLFVLFGLIRNTGAAIMLMTFFTMGYWLMSIATMFLLNDMEKSSALTAIMPVSRLNQVLGKYCSSLLLLVIAVIECMIEYVLSIVMFDLDVSLGLSVLAVFIPSFVMLALVEVPLLFIIGLTRGIQITAVMSAALVWVEMLIDRFFPGLVASIANALVSLPLVGKIMLSIIAIAVLAVASFAVSLRSWQRREW